MDPATLLFAIIVARVIMRAMWESGTDQARAEVRRARDAIRRDLQARRSAAAARLWRRLEAGRAAGPIYPMWWLWAAFRTGGALRRAARRRRRPAERRRRPVRGTNGPA